jgi:hypothetical protein
MAQQTTKPQAKKIFNIMAMLRGNIDIKPAQAEPIAYGSSELISGDIRSKLINGVLQSGEGNKLPPIAAGSLLGMVQTSLNKISSERQEYRKILSLMPEVDKAARLMIATVFSPTDLSRNALKVSFDVEGLPDEIATQLGTFATDFFQDKLNLKTEAPKWMYQYAYESGSLPFAIIPLRSFAKLEDRDFFGTESFTQKILEPLAKETLFGFGDDDSKDYTSTLSQIAQESMVEQFLENDRITNTDGKSFKSSKDFSVDAKLTENLVRAFTGTEALRLTDNPSVLQLSHHVQTKRKSKAQKALNDKFKPPKYEPIMSIGSPDVETEGDPILMRLPPESVTVIHTPGDPNDHQGYLVLLDQMGNPLSSLAVQDAQLNRGVNGGKLTPDVIGQAYNAYGVSGGFHGQSHPELVSRLYNQVLTSHLRKRLDKAGFNDVELGANDAVMRCMFARFLQQKQTRILFLPKELVTYMAVELDENGYGISRIEGIKFSLGMKMAVQVSKILAAIKAAMDKRKINVKFTENMMESPDQVFSSVMQAWIAKSSVTFSTDPAVIQNEMAEKSVSITGSDIPGIETFEITNEPDQRTGAVNFDPEVMEDLNNQINNGLRVPAAAMNQLGQEEYARSVSTTNLFFAMDVSIEQDVVKHLMSDLIRKFARYSESFQKGLIKTVPSLETAENKKDEELGIDKGPTDTKSSKDKSGLPEGITIEKLIDAMVINLPKPDVAPSKAQFEALQAMVESITAVVNAMTANELTGGDATLEPALAFLRARLITTNIRNYLEASGMSSLKVPDHDFAGELGDMSKIINALQNIKGMLDDKVKLNTPAEPALTPPSDPTVSDTPEY